MTMYYQDDRVTLYLGDCLEVTEWLAADVLVTDPPYGTAAAMDYGRGGRYGSSAWCTHGTGSQSMAIAGDDSIGLRDEALSRWGSRPALVFGSWRRNPPLEARAAIVWDKGEASGMGDLSIPWKPNWELIFVVGTGFIGRRDSGILSGGHVVTWTSKGRDHPHMKPVSLMQALIAKCPLGVVADPFAGSGSTLIAAKAQGRHAVGVELEERYCEIAAKRLAQDAFDFGGVA